MKTLTEVLAEIELEKLEPSLDEMCQEIRQTQLSPTNEEVNEGIILTLAGTALSLPAIIKLIGKFVNLIKRIPGFKRLSGDKLIQLGDNWHHKIMNAFAWVIKKAGVKDEKKAHKFANILFHVVVASLLVAGGISMAKFVDTGNVSGGVLKGSLNAVKAGEIRHFLTTIATKI
jgi:hypothetical protein